MANRKNFSDRSASASAMSARKSDTRRTVRPITAGPERAAGDAHSPRPLLRPVPKPPGPAHQPLIIRGRAASRAVESSIQFPRLRLLAGRLLV